MEKTKTWEYLIFRPKLTEGWKCMEQRWNCRYGEVTFARTGKIHHLADDRTFWIVFNEFNPNHYANKTSNYVYSVRGGNDVQPSTKLRFFTNLKDAENYMVYLAESTDKWLADIVSKTTIDAYIHKIEELKKRSNPVLNEY